MNARNLRAANYVAAADPPRDPRVQKFIDQLYSRKMWLMLLGMGVAFGMVELSDIEQAELVEVVIAGLGFFAIAFNIAVEDGLRALAQYLADSALRSRK